MSDGVVELQRVSQSLVRASNAWQGSSFLKYFAAKQVPELSREQASMRLQLLRMTGQLVETEFETAMEELVTAWQKYKETV